MPSSCVMLLRLLSMLWTTYITICMVRDGGENLLGLWVMECYAITIGRAVLA